MVQCSPPNTVRQFLILLGKELRHEMRTRDLLASMGLYAVLVIVVFGAAFVQAGGEVDAQRLSAGLVWVALVFTSLLGLGRSFAFEREAGALDGILLAPIDRSCIYLAKFVSNLIFILAVEVVVLPLFYFFFLTSTSPSESFWLSVVPLLLGTVGIASAGTLLASISATVRGKDLLLAVLFIPVVFPLLYAVVGATTGALVCADGWELVFRNGVVLAGAYDIVMTLAAWLLYDYVVSV